MGRLNQTRRQKIGYVYCPQVINDVTVQPPKRDVSKMQDTVYEQDMMGCGSVVKDMVENKTSDIASKVNKIIFVKPKTDVVRTVKQKLEKRQEDMDGGSRGSIQPSVGGAYHGGAIDIKGNQKGEMLPGDALKRKLLKKMVREKKMKSLGDRVKTQPIEAGFNGGSLVIPTNNNKMGSQSMSKTLPDTKNYKLNPKPLVGAGVIKHLKKSIIPMLKQHKLLPPDVKNTENIKKLIGAKAKKIIKSGIKEPQKVINKILKDMKPILSKVGGGVPLPDGALGVVAQKLAMRIKEGKSKKEQEGGFIIAGLIALGSAIAGAASAAAATTVVGTVTVGSLLGSALTGAAGVGGAELMKKILGKKGGGLPELKQNLVKAAKEVMVTIKDMSVEDKQVLKDALFTFSKNRNKAGAIQFAKSIAPIALKIAKKKLKPKIIEVLKKKGFPMGSGLSLAGSGLVLAGEGEKKFKNEFVKNLVANLEKMKK